MSCVDAEARVEAADGRSEAEEEEDAIESLIQTHDGNELKVGQLMKGEDSSID